MLVHNGVDPGATMADNMLFYGDDLDVLRRHIKNESVDLIDLDPHFNSSRDFNAFFAEQDGTRAAQIKVSSSMITRTDARGF
jgi:hypothetical protein